MKTSLPVVLALFLVGCIGCVHDKFVRGSGDVGQYVLQKAIVLGGRPVSTNSLPKLPSEWYYFQDKSGVVFRLPRDQFLSVAHFLRQAFGRPSMPISDLDNGGMVGVYDVKDIGVSIQFGYDIDIGNNKDYTLIVMSHVSYPIKK